MGCLTLLGVLAWGVSAWGLSGPAFGTLHLLHSTLAALTFAAYIVYDTQLVIGGGHQRFEFSVDDYALAAICLHDDSRKCARKLKASRGRADETVDSDAPIAAAKRAK